MKKFFLLILAFIFIRSVDAQIPGTIDSSFAVEGYSFADHINGVGERFYDLKVLSNGKIVSVGFSTGANQNIIITRYDQNGNIDNSFGVNGLATYDLTIGGDEVATFIMEAPNNKLILVGAMDQGSVNGFIMRVEENGDLDYTFGDGGVGYSVFNAGSKTYCLPYDMQMGNDNSIYIAASVAGTNNNDFGIFKFDTAGKIISSFASQGSNLIDLGGNDMLYAMDINSNNQIVLCGNSIVNGNSSGAIVRLNQFGLIDNSFNGTGFITYNEIDGNQTEFRDVKWYNDRVIVAGTQGKDVNVDGIIYRFKSNGNFDSTFASNGKINSDIGTSNGVYLTKMAITAEGRIVATGHVNGFSMKGIYAIVALGNGNVDFDFSQGGDVIIDFPVSVVNFEISNLALQNNKILLSGYVTGQDFISSNLIMTRVHLNQSTLYKEKLETELNIYPNPTAKRLFVELDEINEIKIYNSIGQEISFEFDNIGKSILFSESLPNGVYFLNIKSKGNTFNKTIILNR